MELVVNRFKFTHTLTISPSNTTIHCNDTTKAKRGVYAVYYNGNVQYVGKYSNGILSRWKHHFKKQMLLNEAAHNEIEVYCLTEQQAKRQTPSIFHKWINNAGIEQMILDNSEFTHNKALNKAKQTKVTTD